MVHNQLARMIKSSKKNTKMRSPFRDSEARIKVTIVKIAKILSQLQISNGSVNKVNVHGVFYKFLESRGKIRNEIDMYV